MAKVRDGMSTDVLVVRPDDTLRETARRLAERNVSAAVVENPERPAPGIITERDLVRSMAEGSDPDSEQVGAHHTADVATVGPEWSLEDAAISMTRRGIRHLIVLDDEGGIAGVLSMRDVVRGWTG